MMAVSRTLASCSPLVRDGRGSLLPSVNDIRQVTQAIALNVAVAAQMDGVAVEIPQETLRHDIAVRILAAAISSVPANVVLIRHLCR